MLLSERPRGGQEIALHQDSHYLPNEPNTLMACWLALTDTDPDNGGLCVVPGSHKGPLRTAHRTLNSEEPRLLGNPAHHERPRRPEVDADDGLLRNRRRRAGERIRLTVPRGAGVSLPGSTIHGSYANRSEARPRIAFATHYIHESTWLFREDVQNPMVVNSD